MFSDDDINVSQKLKAPSYILARDDNKIKMFDPTSSKVQKDTSFGAQFGQGTRFSYGSPVDETPPTPALAAAPPPAQAPPAQTPSAPTVQPVAGSRIMKDFAARHRAQKYKPKTVHIK